MSEQPFRCVYVLRKTLTVRGDVEGRERRVWLPWGSDLQEVLEPTEGDIGQTPGERVWSRTLEGREVELEVSLEEQISVVSERVEIADVAFPLTAPIPAPEFLGSTAYANPESEAVRELAASLSSSCETALEVILAFAIYCYDEIRYDAETFGGLFSDVWALSLGAGSCDEKSQLLAAMCRSVGIPAAVVLGLTPQSDEVGHAWVEVTLDGRRWFPVEATYTPMQIGWCDVGRVGELRALDCAKPAARLERAAQTEGRGPATLTGRFELREVERFGRRGNPFLFTAQLDKRSSMSARLAVRIEPLEGLDAVTHVAVQTLPEVELRCDDATMTQSGGVWLVLSHLLPNASGTLRLDLDFRALGAGRGLGCPVKLRVDGVEVQSWTVMMMFDGIVDILDGDGQAVFT